MAWTDPRTWVTDELVTAAHLNVHVRDNLNALKAPPSDNYELNEGSDYSAGGTGSFADVDATNLALAITTTGGDVMIHFHGTFYTASATATLYLEIDIDGAAVGGDDGIIGQSLTTTPSAVTFTRLVTGLSASSHTIKLQWKAATVARLAAGSGATHDVHPQFWAREVS